MAQVLTHMCMSLDGFVARPDDSPAELFDWYWGGDVVVPSAQDAMSFSVDAASAPMLAELVSGCGAVIAGRRLFDQSDGWEDHHPAGGRVVVVTHRPPPADAAEWVSANGLHRQRRGGGGQGEGDRGRPVRDDRQRQHHPAGPPAGPGR